MALLDTLEAKVTELTEVVDSAEELLGELARLLQEAINSGNPARIQAVVDALESQKSELAAAVAANTPAEVPA